MSPMNLNTYLIPEKLVLPLGWSSLALVVYGLIGFFTGTFELFVTLRVKTADFDPLGRFGVGG